MNARKVNEINRDFQKGLYTGVSILILLGVVGRSAEPLYGYQIAKAIEKKNEDIPVIKLGTLYPVFRTLESVGLLESGVAPSISGPPRRYYRITELGHQTLDELTTSWMQAKEFVDGIIAGAPHDQ
jgi:PadR family transcriptional regulator, regulatory protein PadR